MKLSKIYEDHNVALFPFYFWADSLGTASKPTLGRNVSPVFLTLESGKTLYYVDPEDFCAISKGLLDKFLNGFFEKVDAKSNELYGKLREFSEKIAETDLQKRSNAELASAFREFHELMYQINAGGMAYTPLEYPESKFSEGLEEYLQQQAKKTGASTPASEAFAALTSPTAGTVLRKLLEKICLLATKILENTAAKTLFSKSGEEIEGRLNEFPEINDDLERITADYCWINWGYVGPAMPKAYFISELKQALEEDPEKKLVELRKADAKTIACQQQLLKEFEVDEYHAKRFRLCSDMVHYKGYRKEMIYFGLYSVDELHKEIAKRAGLTQAQARYLLPEEVYAALEKGRQVSADEANDRRKFCAYLIEEGKTSLLDQEAAGKWLALVEEEESFQNVRELKGNCACPGSVKGVVRVVLDANEISKVSEGNVLVSWSTNPNMVPGMRKASAIVTEMGGVASHAAIVSREFKIPCVVGVRGATKALADGDVVEVDATNGIVRKL